MRRGPAIWTAVLEVLSAFAVKFQPDLTHGLA